MQRKSFNFACLLAGAIALTAVPTIPFIATEAEAASCTDDLLADIQLNRRQRSQLEQLEARLEVQDEQYVDSLLDSLSPQDEAKLEQIEASYDPQIEALLSREQRQQVEQLDIWAEQELIKIIPEFAQELETDPPLTAEQERQLDALDQTYEERFLAILTPEQERQLEAIDEQIDAEIEAAFPQLAAEYELQLEALVVEYLQGLGTILTPEQQRQVERDLIACGY